MMFLQQIARRFSWGFLCALLAIGMPSESLAAPITTPTFSDLGANDSSLSLLGPDSGDQMGRVLPPYTSSIVDEPSLVSPVSPLEFDLSTDNDPQDFFNNAWRAQNTVTLPANAALRKERKYKNRLFAAKSDGGFLAKLATPAALILCILAMLAVVLTVPIVRAILRRLGVQMRKTRRHRSGILRIADRRSGSSTSSKGRRSGKRRRSRPMPLVIADRDHRRTGTQVARSSPSFVPPSVCGRFDR